jgi:hypothetical protein
MLGLFSKSRKRSVPTRPKRSRPRLSLECLEDRDCPSAPILTSTFQTLINGGFTIAGMVADSQPSGITVTFTGAVNGTAVTNSQGIFSYNTVSDGGVETAYAKDAQGLYSNNSSLILPYFTPSISNFQATQIAGQTFNFTGKVTDPILAGMQVTLGGLPSINGVTVPVNADGTFGLLVTLQPGECGIASAQTVNSVGKNSNLATCLVDTVPSLTTSIAYGSKGAITLSGQVTASQPGGLTVNFTGAVTGSTVTNADGTYSVQLQGSKLGMIQAQTTDGWGTASNIATVNVAPPAPQITNVTAVEEPLNSWIFSGTVVAPSAPGMPVSFSGLKSVDGQSVNVQVTGKFILVVQLQPNEIGTVEAVTTDWWGQTSNIGYFTVRQS